MEFSLLEQRIRKSYRYITKGKCPDEEDDCVQECLLNFWQKGPGQRVDQAVIEFLRKYKAGRKGSPGYEAKLNLHNASEIPETLSVDAVEPKVSIEIEHLKGRTRYIVEKYIEGFTLKEIGKSLNISESRVSIILSNYTDKCQILSLVPREVRKWAAQYVF